MYNLQKVKIQIPLISSFLQNKQKFYGKYFKDELGEGQLFCRG